MCYTIVKIYIPWQSNPQVHERYQFQHKLPHDIEGIFVELNLRKYMTQLIFGSYPGPSQPEMSISLIMLKMV